MLTMVAWLLLGLFMLNDCLITVYDDLLLLLYHNMHN